MTTRTTTSPSVRADAAQRHECPFAYRHRHAVAVLAGLLLMLCAWAGHDIAGHTSAGGQLPAQAPSLRADRVLSEEFSGRVPGIVVVGEVTGARDVDAPQATAAGLRLERTLKAQPEVERVSGYWTTRLPGLRAQDGRSALVAVWTAGNDDQAARTAQRITDTLGHRVRGLRLSVGGPAGLLAEVAHRAEHDALRSELIALPICAVLLVIALGSPLAASLTVLLGLLTEAITLAVLRFLAEVTTVSVYAVSVSGALAFALALDYTLFVVSRHRTELRQGASADAALRTAMRTAGRTVTFSAATVAGGIAALLVFPHPVLHSVAAACIVATAATALVALLVLPAMLSLLGDRVSRRTMPSLRHSGSPLRNLRPRQGGRTFWHCTALAATRRPVATALLTGLLLLCLALPFGQVRLGLFDDRALPPDASSARAGALLRTQYPDNPFSNTAIVLPAFDTARHRHDLDDYARRVSALSRVTQVATATGTYRHGQLAEPAGDASHRFTTRHSAYLSVSSDSDTAARIRAVPAPATAWLTGPDARALDVTTLLSQRLPTALILVGTTMLVLTLGLTRRPVLALKALVLNTLSLSATFGALVWIFQKGHLRGIVGNFTPTGTTDAFTLVILFCLAFGLSMDYECLLLARAVEEHDTGADTRTAIVRSIASTGHLFTWSAVMLAVVMTALATSDVAIVKATGIGLGLAAVMDATLVRGLLAPAAMRLAGEANWWAPQPLHATPPSTPPEGTLR